MPNVYLSGSSGFVGRNLNAYLKGVSQTATILPLNLRIDPRPEIADDSSIVHLAGKAHDLKSVAEPDEYYQANYALTKSIYDLFLLSNAKKFIFISSVKAVADHPDKILTEEYGPDPKTHYGKSKLLAEKYIQDQPLPAGKSWYILRPCMIHGPGNRGNLNLLYTFVARGLPYPLAAFDNKRSFLSVENLCYVINELLERPDIPSGVYQIADDEPLSTNQVVSLISEALERSPKLLKVPRAIIYSVAKIGDIFKLPLTTERLNKLTSNYIVANKKIKDVLKKELPLSVREGILRTARSFKDV